MSDEIQLWRGGMVPYLIHPSILKDRQSEAAVEKALRAWELAGSVYFEVWSGEEDFVELRVRPGWSESYVGRRKGGQTIYLMPGFDVGHALHELGHALGLLHEHTRPDRDRYLRLYPERAISEAIRDDLLHTQPRRDEGRPYDYGSVMHWPKAPGPEGSPIVMEPTDPSAVIGDWKAPSAGDRASLKILYG